jgi:excisionase family DNA binding protein
MSDGFLLVKEVAELLRVSDETVYRLCRRKQLKATRIGGLWRIPRESVDDLLRKGQVNGNGATASK